MEAGKLMPGSHYGAFFTGKACGLGFGPAVRMWLHSVGVLWPQYTIINRRVSFDKNQPLPRSQFVKMSLGHFISAIAIIW